MKLPIGNQKELCGPSGFELFTNKILVGLLHTLYAVNSTVVYDEVFEILRKRGVFENKGDVNHEPY